MAMPAGKILQQGPRRDPDMRAPHARVWHLSHPDPDMSPTTVDAWLVNCPYAHPYWAYWQFAAIALDPARGFDRRALQFREATHELAIMPLKPDRTIPDPHRWENAAYESPDVKHQIELPSKSGDRAAKVIVGQMVMAVVEAEMSPDKCNDRYWVRSIDAVAEDFREGRRRV